MDTPNAANKEQMIKLHPIPQNKLINLAEIFKRRVEESHIEKRTTVGDLLLKLGRGYDNRMMAAYADDIDNPKACLIMSVFPGLVTDDNYANIILAYVVPELRGNKEYGDALIQVAEGYAKFHKASRLMASSWLYNGSKGIDGWLKKHGFAPQETIYVKEV